MRSTEIQGTSFIGRTPSARGPRTIHARDPATGERLEPAFPEGTPEEADQAVELAARAFEEYRAAAPEARAAFLERIAEEIAGLGDALLERAARETGLSTERLAAERSRTTGQLRRFAALLREGSWVGARIDRADPERKPMPRPDIRRMCIPLGPVVVFGASNFPLAYSVAGGDTASALAAGCTVVVKAHPAHPGTCELAARAVLRAAEAEGMPDGVFSLIHGAGNEVGLRLVRHPLARAAGFTGSLRGGRALFDAAASRPEPIPLHAEMGSINPVFILTRALRERGPEIAAGLVQSLALGAGQFCTSPGVAAGVRGEPWERFLDALRERISAAACGTMLHAGIRKGFEEGTARLEGFPGVSVAARAAAAPSLARNEASPVAFLTDARTFLGAPELREEVFGPSTIVVACASAADLEAIAGSLRGSLTASIHGAAEDLRENARLVSMLETRVGRLIFNGFPTGLEVCPSIHHGGPYPATTGARATSVGTAAIERWVRPICYQNWPEGLLPPELRDGNPRGIWRLAGGEITRGP